MDGIRYHRTEKDFYNMQVESDKLCREYGLSVIDNPKRGKSKHYGEWRAEKEGRPPWRSLLKDDVDTAIRQSMTERQFFDNLCKMGYEVKSNKYISVRPPGKDSFFRLYKNFGEDYSVEAIRERILAQTRPERRIIPADKPTRQVRFAGNLNTVKRITGLRALYFSYLYKMGVLPKKREPSPQSVYFLFREDLRFIRNISKETRLLVKHGIDTAEQLIAHKDGLTAEILTLSGNRKKLRYQSRSIRDDGKLAAVKSDISSLSEKIWELRREVRLCEDIEKRSVEMKEKIHRAAENPKKMQGKEMNQHEPFRRRR